MLRVSDFCVNLCVIMSTALQSLEELLGKLSPGEKAQALQWLVSDLGGVYPGIEKNPQVCGGEACIARTRIPVWLVVQQRNLGLTEAEILNEYPGLRAEDLMNAWNYYRAHKEEIEKDILENETA